MYLYMCMWNFNSIDCFKNKLHATIVPVLFLRLWCSREKNKPRTLSKCQTCACSRMGELRKGSSRAGALYIHTHTWGWFWAQKSAHATFYIFYLLNRPLGKQFGETHENQRELRLCLSSFPPATQPEWRQAGAFSALCSPTGNKRKEPQVTGTGRVYTDTQWA